MYPKKGGVGLNSAYCYRGTGGTLPQISEPTPYGVSICTYHLVVIKTPVFDNEIQSECFNVYMKYRKITPIDVIQLPNIAKYYSIQICIE